MTEKKAREALKTIRNEEQIEAIVDYSRLAKALQKGEIDKIVKKLKKKYFP